jgi:hypothetical protein
MHEDAAGILSALNTIYRAVVTPAVAAAGGRVAKLLGDGALVELPSAGAALRCVTQVQQEMRRPDPPYRFREPITGSSRSTSSVACASAAPCFRRCRTKARA